MTRPLTDVIAEALALPEGDREELVEALCGSLEPEDRTDDDDPLGPGWAAEIKRRIDDLRSGAVKGIPAEEVRRRMEADDLDDAD